MCATAGYDSAISPNVPRFENRERRNRAVDVEERSISLPASLLAFSRETRPINLITCIRDHRPVVPKFVRGVYPHLDPPFS